MNYNDVIEKAIHKFNNELQCGYNLESELDSYYIELIYTLLFWFHMSYITKTKYFKLRARVLDWYNTVLEETGKE